MKKENDYQRYYGIRNISPVHQNIDDLSVHYERRRKLYRQCGIPIAAFRDANILEVGPGSGYNTLAFFHFLNIAEKKEMSTFGGHIDLVEPNPRGVADIEALFDAYAIDGKRYTVHSCMIENFQADKAFDFVIAEGFLQEMHNVKEILQKLDGWTGSHGVLVITCCDDVCMFIEAIKRLLGFVLTKDIDDFYQKCDFLTTIFEPQLKMLRGVSRPAIDWVQDQILNPAVSNGCELTMNEAMDILADDFHLLGSSPSIFNDYSWYKDIWHDVHKDFQVQFKQKRMSLLMAGMPEIVLPEKTTEDLVIDFKRVRELANAYEIDMDNKILKEIQKLLNQMEEKVQVLPSEFVKVFYEIEQLLQEAVQGDIHMGRYPLFFAAFGRTQQYMAFEKKN